MPHTPLIRTGPRALPSVSKPDRGAVCRCESNFERGLELAIFGLRWIMAPIYFALMAVLALLATRFGQEVVEAVASFPV